MKKSVFLTLLLSIVTLTASAQTWVGGELYFRSNKLKLSDIELNSNNSVGIMPEVGYRLNSKWAVALRVEFSHSDNGTTEIADQTLTGNVNAFAVIPFVRYTLYNADKLSFYLDGGIGYGRTKISGYDSFNAASLAISPAISYDLNCHWSLTAHLGSVSYEHDWMDFRNDKLKSDNFNFDIVSNLTLGLSYRF